MGLTTLTCWTISPTIYLFFFSLLFFLARGIMALHVSQLSTLTQARRGMEARFFFFFVAVFAVSNALA